jgi:hypothetical protein
MTTSGLASPHPGRIEVNMGIRETLNDKPQITTAITAGLIVVALIYIVLQVVGGRAGNDLQAGEVFFTTDDGQTWFAMPARTLSPAMKDGKEAVRAYVWTCDGGKTKFVSHLERFTPEAMAKLEAWNRPGANGQSAGKSMDPIEIDAVYQQGREVKKARNAAAKWVKNQSDEAAALSVVTCPDGTQANLASWTPADE